MSAFTISDDAGDESDAVTGQNLPADERLRIVCVLLPSELVHPNGGSPNEVKAQLVV